MSIGIDWTEAAYFAVWILYLMAWFTINRRIDRVQENLERMKALDAELAVSIKAMVDLLKAENAARQLLEEKR